MIMNETLCSKTNVNCLVRNNSPASSYDNTLTIDSKCKQCRHNIMIYTYSWARTNRKERNILVVHTLDREDFMWSNKTKFGEGRRSELCYTILEFCPTGWLINDDTEMDGSHEEFFRDNVNRAQDSSVLWCVRWGHASRGSVWLLVAAKVAACWDRFKRIIMRKFNCTRISHYYFFLPVFGPHSSRWVHLLQACWVLIPHHNGGFLQTVSVFAFK